MLGEGSVQSTSI